MAGVRFSVETGPQGSGVAAHALMQLLAAAHHRVHIHELSVSFRGTNATHAPALVEIVRYSDAGTSVALTPVKLNSGDNETIQTTARKTFTGTEPVATDILFSELITPNGGGYTWGGGNAGPLVLIGGERIGVRVTSANDTPVNVRAVCEE